MWRILIIESGEGLRVASERIKRAIKKGGKKSECYIMEIQVWVVSCKESMVTNTTGENRQLCLAVKSHK